MQGLRSTPARCHPNAKSLRAEVRAFLAEAMKDVPRLRKRNRSWSGASAEFSRKLGERGWIGMTWPRRYGGHERSSLERYVVLEETAGRGRAGGRALGGRPPERSAADALCARHAGAAHRAPHRARRGVLLHRHERARFGFRPGARSAPVPSARRSGWVINGRKLWTSGRAPRALHDRAGAHRRARRRPARRHVAVPGRHALAGLTVRPIINQLGEHDFNEVTLRRRVRAARAPDRRGRRRLEAGGRRARFRAQRPRALPQQHAAAARDAGRRRRRRPAPRRGHRAASWLSTARCGRCRWAWPACWRAARTRPWRPRWSRTRAHWSSRPCPTSRTTCSAAASTRLDAGPGHALQHAGRAVVLAARRHTRDPARHDCQGPGPAMSDATPQDGLIADSVVRLFAEHVDKAARDRAEAGVLDAALWQRVTEGGFAADAGHRGRRRPRPGLGRRLPRAARPGLPGRCRCRWPRRWSPRAAVAGRLAVPEGPLTLIEQGRATRCRREDGGAGSAAAAHGVPWARHAQARRWCRGGPRPAPAAWRCWTCAPAPP